MGAAKTDSSVNMKDILWPHVGFFCYEINIYHYYLMTVAIIKLIFMMILMLHMAEQTVTTLSSLTNFVLTTFSFCPLSKF